jgi:serine/threonine-protein kinase SRPK3
MAHGADRQELDILNHIAEYSSSNDSSIQYFTQLIDHFEYVGPHGTHLFLVFELMWQDLYWFLERYRDQLSELRLPIIKQISRQMILGLDALHRCGVIHNGTQRLINDAHDRFPSAQYSY